MTTVQRVRMTRWTGFGHDRLYVRGEEDEAVGWWDLLADEGHPESADDLARLTDAVTQWRAIEDASAATDGPAEAVEIPVDDVPAHLADEVDIDLESAECSGSFLPHYSGR